MTTTATSDGDDNEGKYEGVSDNVRRKATTMKHDKVRKYRGCCTVFFLRGRGGKRKGKNPKTRDGDDDGGGLARSVGRLADSPY